MSWGAIRRYHKDVRGWSDIGYHAGIELVEGKFECLYGRPDHLTGAHVRSHNEKSLGFCFVGDYSSIGGPPEEMLWLAARRVIAPWCRQHELVIGDIVGHREVIGAETTCPGFAVDDLQEIVARILAETIPLA